MISIFHIRWVRFDGVLGIGAEATRRFLWSTAFVAMPRTAIIMDVVFLDVI